jgi:uncharacterized protein (TIGR01440 family)
MYNIEVKNNGTAELCGDVDSFLAQIKTQAAQAVGELIEAANLQKGQILVVGCSTSEVVGARIGKASVPPAAAALLGAMLPILQERGIYLAAQCCEHLNRALIIEAECAERYGLETVNVRPVPKAGGAFATAVYDSLKAPVAVENIRAHAGLDIGGTLIGMHLRAVAVPVRLSLAAIGEASILCARTRPKYVGGPRAQYE